MKPFDPIALRVGTAFKRGLATYVEAGRLLIERKASLKHGEWLPWLKANADALGFSDGSTASRLMKLVRENANLASTHDLPDVREITRQLWGNDTDYSTYEVPAASPSPIQVRLAHAPCELAEANAVVIAWHRHHKELPGHRFSLKCLDTSVARRGKLTP